MHLVCTVSLSLHSLANETFSIYTNTKVYIPEECPVSLSGYGGTAKCHIISFGFSKAKPLLTKTGIKEIKIPR